MKYIKLTQNKRVKVSDSWFEKLNQHKWQFSNGGYAVRSIYDKTGKKKTILMHKIILPSPKHFQIDHIDRDRLNCQVENLRVVSPLENAWNNSKQESSSKYKGVTWNKKLKKWFVQMQCNKEKIYLGLFTSETEAAKQYDNKAKQLFGEYASLNFK